jgi:hypothetical protein
MVGGFYNQMYLENIELMTQEFENLKIVMIRQKYKS